MSDINISGIPNMGFQGGGGGIIGGIPNQQPAMSANQINQSMWGNYSPQQAQYTLDNIYGPGGFGGQTSYYSGLGASYGRATGGFGKLPSGADAPAGRTGTINNPGAANPGYLSGGGADPFTGGAPPVNHYGGLSGNQIFDSGRYFANNPDVWSSGADAWQHYNQFGQHEGRQGTWSDIFNSTSYAQKNPDVANSGMDPTAHWYQFGQKEGRQGQVFDPGKYLYDNPDVWQAGADPWQHYKMFGEKEGRAGSWTDAFNADKYLQANPDVAAAGVDPTAHWYQFGSKEGRQGDWGGALSPLDSYQGTGFDAFDPNIYGGSHPTAGFGQQPAANADPMDWGDLWKERGPFNRSPQQGAANEGRDDFASRYYAANRDVYDAARASGQDFTDFAKNHIMAYGDDEGRGFFDEDRYLQQNQDVAASGMDPTAHWMQFGQKEGREAPMAQFNYADYLAKNPDVLGSGMDPMAHWLEFGANEKRQGALGANQNTLVAERNAFAEMVRTNPALANQLAVKLYQEDQGSGDSRTAIMETMLNRLNATGQNPLNPAYYPKDKGAYNSQIENKVLNDEALLSQIYQEMERAFGGSNLSNYATDWGSADVANTARQYATPTWTSPTNEQFFRKDISNPWAGAGTAARNQKWYNKFNK